MNEIEELKETVARLERMLAIQKDLFLLSSEERNRLEQELKNCNVYYSEQVADIRSELYYVQYGGWG